METVPDGLLIDVCVGGDPEPSPDGTGRRRSGLQGLSGDIPVLSLCGATRASRPGPGFNSSSGLEALPQPYNDRMGAVQSCGYLPKPDSLLEPRQSSSSVDQVQMSSWRHGWEMACCEFARANKA